MWFYIKIRQNQQFAFIVMRDVWYGRWSVETLHRTNQTNHTNLP